MNEDEQSVRGRSDETRIAETRTAESRVARRALGVATALLAAFSSLHVSEAADNPMLIVRERVTTWTRPPCPSGALAQDVAYSELRVFTTEQAEERTWRVAGCGGASAPRDWTAPAGSTRRTFRVPAAEFQQLTALLETLDVQRLTPFMNAGPGVGDYEVEIYRASGVQRISAVGLMPEHVELRRNPTLLRLVCAGKRLAKTTVPGWCPP